MKSRDYIVLISAIGLGIISGAAMKLLHPFPAYLPLLHLLGSRIGDTLVRMAGFGVWLSRLNRYIPARF
jgi:hypothetical protein